MAKLRIRRSTIVLIVAFFSIGGLWLAALRARIQRGNVETVV